MIDDFRALMTGIEPCRVENEVEGWYALWYTDEGDATEFGHQGPFPVTLDNDTEHRASIFRVGFVLPVDLADAALVLVGKRFRQRHFQYPLHFGHPLTHVQRHAVVVVQATQDALVCLDEGIVMVVETFRTVDDLPSTCVALSEVRDGLFGHLQEDFAVCRSGPCLRPLSFADGGEVTVPPHHTHVVAEEPGFPRHRMGDERLARRKR